MSLFQYKKILKPTHRFSGTGSFRKQVLFMTLAYLTTAEQLWIAVHHALSLQIGLQEGGAAQGSRSIGFSTPVSSCCGVQGKATSLPTLLNVSDSTCRLPSESWRLRVTSVAIQVV